MGSATEPRRAEDLAQTMVEQIMATTSHAEALRKLRAAYPESPLTLRVAALAMLRKSARDPKLLHIPR